MSSRNDIKKEEVERKEKTKGKIHQKTAVQFLEKVKHKKTEDFKYTGWNTELNED